MTDVAFPLDPSQQVAWARQALKDFPPNSQAVSARAIRRWALQVLRQRQAPGPGETRPSAPSTGVPTVGVAPTDEQRARYDAQNPHPASIAAQIDQLEQLGRNRTPEQTDQLQELYQQRQDAEAPSPEAAARQTQITQLDTQISTLGAQITRAEARKNAQISPPASLIAKRAQLDDLIQQRRGLVNEQRAAAPDENQRIAQSVYGPPEGAAPETQT